MTATATRLVQPRSVVDTTDRGWTPVRVTATYAQPIVGLPRDPMHLDGPLSWAAYVDACTAGDQQVLTLPPLARDIPPTDLALPLATWTMPASGPDPDPCLLAADGRSVWGWACSAAMYRVTHQDTVWVRRKPELGQMAYWTSAAKHHIGLGPRRAANIPHQAVWVDQMAWWALADEALLRQVLTRLTHAGRTVRHGNGHIQSITVTSDPAAVSAWWWRDMPDPAGQLATVRAPYWHPSRRMPCTRPTAPQMEEVGC